MAYVNAGRIGVIGAPTYPMLRDATQTSLFEVLEVNRIPFTHAKSENLVTFEETGSRILLRSMEEFERLRGTNIAWFGMDELTYTHEEAWLRLEGRLRDPKARQLCGFAVWTPKGHDWVYRRFLEDSKGRYDVFRAKPFENSHILDTIPDYYEKLKHSYDEKFYQQEVLGEYLNTAGDRAYSAFEHLANVRPQEVDQHLPICWAMDFNVDPLCSVVAQIDHDTIRVLDEVVLRRAATQDACDEFSLRYGSHPAGYTLYGDASGQARSTKGSSDFGIVKEHFWARNEQIRLAIPKANPAVRTRVHKVNGKLKAADGERRMFIDTRCVELIKDLEQVAFSPEGDLDKTKDRNRTHSSDALGYLVCAERSGPTYGEQRNRIL